MARQIRGSDLLHHPEKFKEFTGDNMNKVLNRINQVTALQNKKSHAAPIPINLGYQHATAHGQKQLVLE